jgi:hypothetical protein
MFDEVARNHCWSRSVTNCAMASGHWNQEV